MGFGNVRFWWSGHEGSCSTQNILHLPELNVTKCKCKHAYRLDTEMHTLNLGNANLPLIHLPKECQCRDKSVNWLRPQQLWVSPNTNHAQPRQLGEHPDPARLCPAGTKLNSCWFWAQPDLPWLHPHSGGVPSTEGQSQPCWG